MEPIPGKHHIHPELLDNIPVEWRGPLAEFLTTGTTLAPGFNDFLDSSKAAQESVDQAFSANLRGAAQAHIERIHNTGGSYQAAESMAQQGVSLDQAFKLADLLNGVAERLVKEQQELDQDLD